jgi:small-conductance mechanosensitive channel
MPAPVSGYRSGMLRDTLLLRTVTWSDFIQAIVSAFATAAVVALAGYLAFRLMAHHWPAARRLDLAARVPYGVLLVVVAAVVAARTPPRHTRDWWPDVQHGLHIVLIVTVAWLVGAILLFLEDTSLLRHRVDVPDNREARRIRTQVLLMRRLTTAAVVVIAISAVLLSFSQVRTVGASLLASAGILSVIAGLAAQSTLGNVFAGITLVFSDALRLDDAVIVEDEWGTVEEFTLTYVVVRLWDDRRLVLPTTYFSQNPFENWTRRTSELLGAVEFDLDWRVDTEGMRLELNRILERTDLWDRRVQVLQVTDAVSGWVHVRILVTAKDAPTLFDLRCLVREQLVGWLQRHNADGLPRWRTEAVESQARTYSRQGPSETMGLFTGDPEAESRAARAGGGEGR